MAAKGLPKIRAGMGDVDAPVVEAWSDDDYRRATSLGTILSPDGKADRAGVPALEPAALRECYRTMLRIRALGDRARARADERREPGDAAPGTHGSEAAIVGAVAALEADDIVVPGRREAVAALWRGHSRRGPGRGRCHPARARRVARVAARRDAAAARDRHRLGDEDAGQGKGRGRAAGAASWCSPSSTGKRPAPRTFTPG